MGYGKNFICLRCKFYGRVDTENGVEEQFCSKGAYKMYMVDEIITSPKICKCSLFEQRKNKVRK